MGCMYLSIVPVVVRAPIRIIESKAPGFPVGALVSAHVGWRSRSIVDVNTPLRMGIKVELVEEVPGLSPSLWLGAIGMPGWTAYLSFFERCDPKEGEVIVVSAASGAVGSIVGQLAKLQISIIVRFCQSSETCLLGNYVLKIISNHLAAVSAEEHCEGVFKGLTVIGLAGSNDKCNYIKEIGFDYAINYKQEDIPSTLDKIAPDGVDIYYENVGGDISDAVYGKLREKGRVLICGLISTYNTPQPKVTNWNFAILYKELRIQGFRVYNESNKKQFPRVRKALVELFQQVLNVGIFLEGERKFSSSDFFPVSTFLIMNMDNDRSGKLKAKEHITEGFENMPKAFIELFTGANFGKAILKV